MRAAHRRPRTRRRDPSRASGRTVGELARDLDAIMRARLGVADELDHAAVRPRRGALAIAGVTVTSCSSNCLRIDRVVQHDRAAIPARTSWCTASESSSERRVRVGTRTLRPPSSCSGPRAMASRSRTSTSTCAPTGSGSVARNASQRPSCVLVSSRSGVARRDLRRGQLADLERSPAGLELDLRERGRRIDR